MADGLFDDPADRSEPDDLPPTPLRDEGRDSLGAEPLTEGPGIEAAVGQDRIGPAARSPDSSSHGTDGVDQVGGGALMSGTFAPVVITASGIPAKSQAT